MRIRKPWFRKAKNAWYVEVNGKQVRLAVGRDQQPAAMAAFYKLMAGERSHAISDGLLAITLCDLFLDYSAKHNAATSYKTYRHFLQDFCSRHPTLPAAQLKPFHVSRWLDEHPTWKGCRCHAIGSIKRAYSWAEQEGLIDKNPIQRVKKPSAGRRERVLTAREKQLILDSIPDQYFRDFVFAMQETGCRPGEVASVTATDCQLASGVWVLQQHKTAGKTGRPRVIYLTPAMVDLSTRLVVQRPQGPLFCTAHGTPWLKSAIVQRFHLLRKMHPELAGVVAYSYRHSFATDALVNGVGVAHVAELLGHTSTTMVMKHYSHLADNIAHMRQAALRATQGPSGTSPGPSQ